MYNEGLLGDIEKLDQAFPRKLHLPELQKELPAYQELPRSEWLLAVQALRLDGALNGKFLRKVAQLQTPLHSTSRNEAVQEPARLGLI